MLDLAKKQVKFDPTCDRLFSVGDLVDRGAESSRLSEFLLCPYAFAVCGNHDIDFCRFPIDQIRAQAASNWNGMGWAKDLSDAQIINIQDTLEQLPLVIEIETDFGIIGIVHAEVPIGMHWPQFLEKIESRNMQALTFATTRRTRLKQVNTDCIDGVYRIFSGHTVQWDGAIMLGNTFFIDTGAVFAESALDAGLRCVEVDG